MGTPRFLVLYLSAGIFGFVLGANFALVGQPSVGASGAIFGTHAALLVDLLAHWKIEYRPKRKLVYLLIEIIIGLGLGWVPGVRTRPFSSFPESTTDRSIRAGRQLLPSRRVPCRSLVVASTPPHRPPYPHAQARLRRPSHNRLPSHHGGIRRARPQLLHDRLEHSVLMVSLPLLLAYKQQQRTYPFISSLRAMLTPFFSAALQRNGTYILLHLLTPPPRGFLHPLHYLRPPLLLGYPPTSRTPFATIPLPRLSRKHFATFPPSFLLVFIPTTFATSSPPVERSSAGHEERSLSFLSSNSQCNYGHSFSSSQALS